MTQLINDFIDHEFTVNFSVVNSVIDVFLYSTRISNIHPSVKDGSSPGHTAVVGWEGVIDNKRKGRRGQIPRGLVGGRE